MNSIIFEEDITITFLSKEIDIEILIYGNYKTSLTFYWQNHTHLYVVNDWSTSSYLGFTIFVMKFHGYTKRDPEKYGSSLPDKGLKMTQNQRILTIVQICKDIFAVMEQIITIHKTSTLPYANWYVNKFLKKEINYADEIQTIACKLIIQEDISNPLQDSWKEMILVL